MKNIKKLLALGDSYTIGEAVETSDSWPFQLITRLTKPGINFDTPEVVAKTGWTTGELISAIQDIQIDCSFDLVSLQIGVNNQYRGRDLNEFRAGFSELIDLAIKFASGISSRVFILSIPDWSVTPFAEGRDRNKINQEIKRFNTVIMEMALKRELLAIDITPISRLAENDTSLLAGDGLHPSGKMYRLWVNEIIQKLE